MKKLSFNRFSDWWAGRPFMHIPVWIGLHLILFLSFAVWGRYSVDVDLYNALPDANTDPGRAEAERRITSDFGRGFTLLVGHPHFEKARALAAAIAAALRAEKGLSEVTFEIDASRLRVLRDFLFRFRYQLPVPAVREALLRGDASALSENAFAALTNPVNLGGLDRLDLDPFLLAEASLAHYLKAGLSSGMALRLQDGVLAAEHDGRIWILVSGRTTGPGLTADPDAHPAAAVRRTASQIAAADAKAVLVFSGAPFHSYESAREAQFHIGVLGAVSLAVVVVLLLVFFRSVRPLLFTLGSTALGIGAGMAAAFLAFGKIHLFTIVFGTSIIGISIDYALEYFTVWATPPAVKPFGRTLAFILPGVGLALFTTLASYVGFMFTAFPLLRQMALFSIAGLISGSLSVLCVFPRLSAPSPRTVRAVERMSGKILMLFEMLGGLRLPVKLALLASGLIAAAVGLSSVRLSNEVQSLYRMSPEMKKNESLSAAVLKHGSAGVYALVEGDDAEEVRRREEQLLEDLAPLTTQGKLGSALGTTLFIPSASRQAENYALAETVLTRAAAAQLALLMFGEKEARAWEADFKEARSRRATVSDLAHLPLGSLARGLTPGAIGGRYYQAVLLFNVLDQAAVKAAVESRPGRTYVDRIGRINDRLSSLTRTAFIVICISYAVICVGLILRYGFRRGVLIVLIPVLASAASVALLSAVGLPFNVFSVMALILIPGIGSDYVIFCTEGRSRPAATVLAVVLSMFTTVTSFGLLGFTSLAYVFGLTASLGIFFSFIFTPLFAGGLKMKKATPTTAAEVKSS